MRLDQIQALLIDIDDTITRQRTGPEYKPVSDSPTASLFDVLRAAAIEQAHLPMAEIESRIAKMVKEVQWWRWSDFIVELGLDPRDFWDFAATREAAYIEASAPDLRPALERLRRHGFYLYITSNNPADGILHKLRIAGLGHIHGAPLFHQFLGPPELKAMKRDRLYWLRALAHTGFRGNEVAVIGDSLRDDYEVPRTAGIAGTFLYRYRPDDQFTEPDNSTLIHVRSFSEVADQLLSAQQIAPP